MYLKATKALTFILIILLLFTSCNNGKNLTKSNFTIVTSFYPIYITTINITKDIPGVEVINMTKAQTGCLHDYIISPQDIQTLEKADAFIINGAGMETFMGKVMSQQINLKVIDASKNIQLIKNLNGEDNAHVWVSVTDIILQVNNITQQLSIIDQANASMYESNAKTYISKLELLKDKMHMSLDGLENKKIVTFHEAFSYFAKEFNLNTVAVIEREPGREPTPKELESIIKIVKEHQIKALFAEPQYQAKAADTIAQETGAKVYRLDPIVTGDANPNGFDDYISKMEQNMKTLREALK